MALEDLLIYYGWPTCINGGASPEQEFGRYQHVILGDGLHQPCHPDHAGTRAIVGACADTAFYGYVDLGVTTQNLALTEVARRCQQWREVGCRGVLFDDFGYDFQTERTRQNRAVNEAHSLGLAVIANAWEPGDAFDSRPHRRNPGGEAPALGREDFFLVESFQVVLGVAQSVAAWRERAARLEVHRRTLGFSVLSVTTSAPERPFVQELFDYSYYSALVDGHRATGWGEPGYAATDARAPYRPRPLQDPGRLLGPPKVRSQMATVRCESGELTLSPGGVSWRARRPGLLERIVSGMGRNR